MLESCLSKPQRLAELIAYSEDSIVSKMILDTPAGHGYPFCF
jgi:hypothetical protein